MPSKNQYLYAMNDEKLRLMMLDIDGVLTHHHATTADVLTAAQALVTSAIGDLVNKSAVHADNNVQCSMFNQPKPSTAPPMPSPSRYAPPSTPASTRASGQIGNGDCPNFSRGHRYLCIAKTRRRPLSTDTTGLCAQTPPAS